MSGTDGRRALSKYIASWKIEDSTHFSFYVCVSPWCWQPRRCDPGRCSRWRRPLWGLTPALRPVWGQSRLGRCSWRWGNPSSRCQGPQPGTWRIKLWGNREKVLLFVYAKWDVYGGWRETWEANFPCENFDCSLLKSCLASLILLTLLNEFASLLIKLFSLLLEVVTPVIAQLGRSLLITPGTYLWEKQYLKSKYLIWGI